MDSRAVLAELKRGNERFRTDNSNNDWADARRRATLLSGQHPIVAILACADSRVSPQIVFDAGLGELFTVKVAGNVADKSVIASLEYAVTELGIKLIIVMGHEGCGAVGAALQGGANSPHLRDLLKMIRPAIDACSTGDAEDVIRLNAELAADRCVRQSRILTQAVEMGALEVATGYYHLDTGLVEFDAELEGEANP